MAKKGKLDKMSKNATRAKTQPRMRINLAFEQAMQKMVKVADTKAKARARKK
jgi:hypothetical protein